MAPRVSPPKIGMRDAVLDHQDPRCVPTAQWVERASFQQVHEGSVLRAQLAPLLRHPLVAPRPDVRKDCGQFWREQDLAPCAPNAQTVIRHVRDTQSLVVGAQGVKEGPRREHQLTRGSVNHCGELVFPKNRLLTPPS